MPRVALVIRRLFPLGRLFSGAFRVQVTPTVGVPGIMAGVTTKNYTALMRGLSIVFEVGNARSTS